MITVCANSHYVKDEWNKEPNALTRPQLLLEF